MADNETISWATRLVESDPARAASLLAERTERLQELESCLGAIRAFSQNTHIAKFGKRDVIEWALDGRKLD